MASRALLVNDVHSGLNQTAVERIVRPGSFEDLRRAIFEAAASGRALAICGGRHAMGGQQFATGDRLLDVTRLDRVLRFDAERGLIEVEAGIQWPALVRYLLRAQKPSSKNNGAFPSERPFGWGIAQKQTGADTLTLGGALSANVHGRGLTMRPLIDDVESLILVDAQGAVRSCSRTENPALFSLVIGGYGLFGVIYSLTLRLSPRQKVRRVVEVIEADTLNDRFAERIADGYLYGDWQYVTDPESPDFLRRGVFSCYLPVGPDEPIAGETRGVPVARRFTRRDWQEMVYLGHTDKTQAFSLYADYYRSTSGETYWSDTHQMAGYLPGYHAALDRRLGSSHPGSEMITELFVPRERLADFLSAAGDALRAQAASVIYGTVRLVEPDRESVLAWARSPWACIIFNLHTDHSPDGKSRAADAFRSLIDLALERGGSYYLTYHRWANRAQVLAAYPQMPAFLQSKRDYDPDERLQSDWYRHHRDLLA